MIKGHATIDGTADFAARYAPDSYVPLGSSGLKASQAGFGGYRISIGISQHKEALMAAIRSGINLRTPAPTMRTAGRKPWSDRFWKT